MEQTPLDNQFPSSNSGNALLPNSTAVLVLGILSILGCFCYGILGIILGSIGLVLANKDLQLYNANPTQYSPPSYNNLKAGRICAIIGLALGSLYLLIIIGFVIIYGSMLSLGKLG
jgi:hypothetical protein